MIMVKHIVLWMLKPEAKETPEILAENMDRLTKRFHSMKEASPMMNSISVYPTLRHGNDIYDFAVVMEFDDLKALEEFQVSPAHKDPKESKFGLSIREKKAVIDIEIDN